MASKSTCLIKGCPAPVAVRKHGLCRVHVQRFYRTGVPGPALIRRHRALAPFRGTR